MNTPDTPTRTVTPDELGLLLSSIKGATPVGLSTLTDARAKKTTCPYGTIRKLSRCQAFIGFDYTQSVTNRRAREGEHSREAFQAQEHAWGERVCPASLRHPKTGDLYLVAKVERASEPTYLYQRTAGFWSPVEKEKVTPYLPPPRTDSDAARQGVDKPVVYRNWRLDSIVTLTMNGIRYRVRRTNQGMSL